MFPEFQPYASPQHELLFQAAGRLLGHERRLAAPQRMPMKISDSSASISAARPRQFTGGISTRWCLCFAVAALAVLVGGGCGRRGLAVEMVKGRVLLDGEPLDGASVGFLPASSGKGEHAFGLTEADGSFRLTAIRGGAEQAGTATGDYRIVISKIVRVDPNAPPPSVKPRQGASYPKLDRVGAWQPDSLIIVPDDYGMAATSGLTATVKKGVNEFTFELRSDYEKPAAKNGT